MVGVLVAMVMMFSPVNERIDRMQAETSARFDAVLEAIMSFDRRVSRPDAQGAGAAE